jgi:hypothetical protein
MRPAFSISLFLLALVPCAAIAQQSSSATQTVRFTVLPVHVSSAVLAGVSHSEEKVTVAVSASSAEPSAAVPAADARTIFSAQSLPSRLPRGAMMVITITD